ncbi:ABC transporter [Altererythrobacter xixiisoli]|uniref:ABC transporter n=1 Tax=Croceibacterium xixiisoli TaxID=1476466 RepID=A0A6I4TTJ9_9SPHN|nr:ABC transporter [Croceibacterium xixiisoli]MXO98187.1 ABC transporter [Croceibacterium xixiisoli]
MAGAGLILSIPLHAGTGTPDQAIVGPDAGNHGTATPDGQVHAAKPALGLMGTIPIYWGEADGLSDVIGGTGDVHWARAQLEADFQLRPLDTLLSNNLKDLQFLLLAQPRALTAEENVALDGWVRAGGRLLLFADPMLTGESRFGIGDRRRPQDVILLSPILRHWGLELQFDDLQPADPALADLGGAQIPVRLPGRFVAVESNQATEKCDVSVGGLMARCRAIGAGQLVALADAAVLDLHHPAPEAADSLAWLVRESTGISTTQAAVVADSRNIDLNHNDNGTTASGIRSGWPPGRDE